MSYVYPPLLKKQLPSNEELIKVLMQAELEDPEKRDVRPLMSVLMRLKKVDPRLSRHILRRKSLIAGVQWDITAYDKGDEERAAEAKRRLKPVIERLFDLYIESHMFGVAACRLEWDSSSTATGSVPSITKTYKPYELEYNQDFHRNIAVLSSAENNKFTRAQLEDSQNITHISNTYETDEYGGVLRTILFHEFRLYESDKEWHRFIQLLKGILQGKYEDGAQPDSIHAGKQALEDAITHQAAFTSEKVNFMFHKITDPGGGSSIGLYQESIIDAIEIAITGTSSLASDRKRNAPTVQERAEEDIAYWGRKGLAGVLNDQLLPADWQRNGSVSGQVPWEFGWSVQRSLDPESMARTIDLISQIVDIPISEVTRLTGLRPADADEDSIWKRAKNAPNFSGFAPQ